MAFLPQPRLEEILQSANLDCPTPCNIDSREALIEELHRIRSRGFCINNEEISLGVRSVAAPIRDHSGQVVAGVNIVIPAVRVSLETLETKVAQKVIDGHREGQIAGPRFCRGRCLQHARRGEQGHPRVHQGPRTPRRLHGYRRES